MRANLCKRARVAESQDKRTRTHEIVTSLFESNPFFQLFIMASSKDAKVNKSKTVSSGTVEGVGIYSCTAGACADNPFSTSDKEEWETHQRESPRHYLQGVAPCAICGQEVNLAEVLTRAGNKPIHAKCLPQPEDEL